jgi:hypothetical protein
VNGDHLLTFKQAAKHAGRTERTIWNWQRDGMPTELTGHIRHVRLADLTRWMVEHRRRTGRARDDF